MNFQKKIRTSSVGFQMAPMLDIIFIMLIHFMAATIFAQWEHKLGIKVPTADSGTRGIRQRGEVIINVDEAGTIYINSQEMSAERLESLLAEIADAFQEYPVVIRADRNTRHQSVMTVLDICTRVKIHNVAFSSIPAEGQLE
ncbi:MAG: biopolymer transporter ExbD [Lentisphaerae bacterium]|jgi:biopolymer transport protein ExbD|nr:biopolymer transporter ExbD [Lentisphaerota bacterium]